MTNEIKKAAWIKAAEDLGDTVPIFTKTFSAQGVTKATLELTAVGVYCAYLNGKRISDYVLAPGWTQYDKRLQYQSYDITAMVKEENLLQIGVGMGWRMHTKDEPLAVLGALILDKEDGSREVLYTDRSWRYATGNTLFSNMYNGETYDANLKITEIGYAEEYAYTKDILIPQQGEIIKEQERLPAKEIIITPSGDTVIDFGQNLTGYVEFRITGKPGEQAKITHAEVLDKDGEFYTENMRSAKNEITFICDGGEHVFKPRYTFQGFRYIKLSGWSDEIKLEHFTAIVVHSDIKRIGHFRCSSEMLNKLYHNIIWGQKGNFLDIPTDCPQRDERLGWTGDAQVFVRTATYNYDVEKFFTKWLADLAAAQQPDGRVPHVVPLMHWWNKSRASSSAAWADAAVICPWQIYLTYGNKDILVRQFESMKKWVDYIAGAAEDYLWLQGDHFGDWLGLDANDGDYTGRTDKTLIATAYFAYSCSLLIKAGHVLETDMSAYEDLYAHIKQAYQNRYMENGRVLDNTQTACAVTLYFDLCEDKSAAEQLAEIVRQDGHMTTGFVGTPYILHALSENGYADLAYSLLLREEYPSWLYSVTMGATTVWEHWDGIKPDGSMWSKDMNSFNHYAYGAVYDWMFGVMAGIRTDEKYPAFRHIIFNPVTDERIDFVEASIESRYGTVQSSWIRQDGSITYRFLVPEGTAATWLHEGTAYALGAGEHVFKV